MFIFLPVISSHQVVVLGGGSAPTPSLLPSLTQHGGLLQELVAGLEGHLLQGGGARADGVAVQRLVDALVAHVVGHQRQVPRIHLDPCKHTQRSYTAAPAGGDAANDSSFLLPLSK